MSHGPKLLSIIVPAYHQEKIIEYSLQQLYSAASQLLIPYEIIVVVDGTDDATFKRASKNKKNRIKVIGYQHNHGKGYAVRYGMARSHGDVVAFIDVGDIHPESLSMMLEHFRWYNADIVVGSKRHPVSIVNYPTSRKIFSWGYQFLVRLLFGLKIRDTQVGIKLYRREVLEEVLPRLLVKKFAFDIEILSVAHHLGYTRIFEAPVELDFSHISSITSFTVWPIILRMLWDTAAVFYRLKILHYYDTSNKRVWRLDPELNYRVNLS